MNIFPLEKSLTKLINSKVTASLVVPLKLSDDKEDLFIENMNSMNKDVDSRIGRSLAKVVASESHPDLMYASAILVSTVMNKNDDVFLPEETWAARNTPVNTPYNDEHVDVDIIGHIIAARPLDSEGKVIEASEKAPDYFDIEVDLVVYKSIFPAVAAEIAEKGPKGEKFVSMEATFGSFDYCLIGSDNQMKVYARNEQTSFLTKYLRVYGGPGTYQDYKIGRVLRDFRFSGVGNVSVPANPASEYTKIDDYIFASVNDIKKEQSKVVFYITKGKTMKVETVEQAQAEIDKLLEAQKNQSAEVEKGKTDLTAANSKVEIVTQELTTVKAELEEVKKSLESTKTELTAKANELAELAKTAKANERFAQLKEIGVEVPEEKRKSYANMDDDSFANLLDFAKSVKATKKEDKKEETVDDATNKAKSDLDAVKVDTTPDVTNTKGNDDQSGDDLQKTAAKLVDFLRNRPDRNSRKSKKKE